MTDANDSEAVSCRDIDPVDLFEQGVAPGAYHDLQEVAQELTSDRSSCKIVFIEEKCSRCSAKISGLRFRGDGPELVHNLKWVISDVYEAFYEDPRPVQFVAMTPPMVELGQDAVMELSRSLQLAAVLGSEDAGDGTSKRSKQEIRARILGPDFADAE